MSTARALVSVLAASLLLASVGIGAEAIARRGDERAHPPRGELVSVEGHRMHIACHGPAVSPTVVFEAGLGESSLTWIDVQRLLMPRLHVCVYDRSGYGWSEPVDGPRDIRSAARELRELLQAADTQAPYVLVGHSYGTWILRTFAADYPDLVAGGVLVDPVDEQHRGAADQADLSSSLSYLLLELSGWVGVTRLLGDVMAPRLLPAGAPEHVQEAADWLYRKEAAQTATRELAALERSTEILGELDEPDVWADRPLTVISAADSTAADRKFHASLAWMSGRGELELAERGRHYVHYAEPRLVARAITDTVVRTQADGA